MAEGGHVFLSYRSLERAFALRLGAALRAGGVAVWVDCLPEGIRAGDDWPRTLEQALDTCSALIAVVSPEYVASKVCRRELHRADQLGRPLFPVLLEPVGQTDWPLEVERLQYVDFTGWRDDAAFEAAAGELVERVRAGAGELVGQRPDPEQQYLLTLIADLQARGGVADYTALLADLVERAAPAQSRERPLTTRWGLDAEFTLLEPSAGPTAPADAEASEPGRGVRRRLGGILEVLETPRRSVILGEPGAGKTTTLRRLALESARRRLDGGDGAPLPLVLSLPRWRDEPDVASFVAGYWPFASDPAPAIASGEVALFFDGLNEMGDRSTQRLALLRQWLSSDPAPRRLLVTCRSRDYERLRLPLDEVVIHPMDADRIRGFVHNYLGNRAAGFLQRIAPASHEDPDSRRSIAALASNPYLLTCLLIVHETDPSGALPRNPGAVFRRLVEFLWNRELIRQTPGWTPFPEVETRLARLAFRMIASGSSTSIPAREANDSLGAATTVAVAQSASLLDREGDQIRFSHHLIQEYFAAVELDRGELGRALTKPERTLRYQWRRETKWDGPILALLGITDDVGGVAEVVSRLDPELLAEAVGETETISREHRAIVAEKLIEALENDDWSVRAGAAQGLGTLREESAVLPLIAALADPYSQVDGGGYVWKTIYPVRRSAAMALGELGDLRAVDALLAAAEDPENDWDTVYKGRTNAADEARLALDRIRDAGSDDA